MSNHENPKAISLTDVAAFLSKLGQQFSQMATDNQQAIIRQRAVEDTRMATLFTGADFELLIAIREKGGEV